MPLSEGVEKAGHIVREFFLSNMNIHNCKGCFSRHSTKECPCIQRDDMDQIYPAVRESDVVVLASPLYHWSLRDQLRTAMDRLFALEDSDGNLLRGRDRFGMLLMTAEGHGFEDVQTCYSHLMKLLPQTDLSHVLASGNADAGDIGGKPELQQALGRFI